MKKRILLVDDDEICHFLHTKVIEQFCNDCDIQTAANGADALVKLKATVPAPDLILLDLNMPVMDGFEFLKRFEQMQIPGKEMIDVVVLTSSVRKEDITRASAFRILKFLTKPLTEQDASRIIMDQ